MLSSTSYLLRQQQEGLIWADNNKGINLFPTTTIIVFKYIHYCAYTNVYLMLYGFDIIRQLFLNMVSISNM